MSTTSCYKHLFKVAARISDRTSSGSSQHLLTRASARPLVKSCMYYQPRLRRENSRKIRPLCQDVRESVKLTPLPQRERSDRHKVPRIHTTPRQGEPSDTLLEACAVARTRLKCPQMFWHTPQKLNIENVRGLRFEVHQSTAPAI